MARLLCFWMILLFCPIDVLYGQFNNAMLSSSMQSQQYQSGNGMFSSPIQTQRYQTVNGMFMQGPSQQWDPMVGPVPPPSFSSGQDIDYSLQGRYQSQTHSKQYMTTHTFPNYNQPGLPWHTRQEMPITQHVIHHHHYQNPGPVHPPLTYGPMYPQPALVHPSPIVSVAGPAVGIPLGGYHPIGSYHPDLLTHVINHPVGRVATTAGLAALFVKAIDK